MTKKITAQECMYYVEALEGYNVTVETEDQSDFEIGEERGTDYIVRIYSPEWYIKILGFGDFYNIYAAHVNYILYPDIFVQDHDTAINYILKLLRDECSD